MQDEDPESPDDVLAFPDGIPYPDEDTSLQDFATYPEWYSYEFLNMHGSIIGRTARTREEYLRHRRWFFGPASRADLRYSELTDDRRSRMWIEIAQVDEDPRNPAVGINPEAVTPFLMEHEHTPEMLARFGLYAELYPSSGGDIDNSI